jgi:NCS1 nucleoside transporter family
VWQTGEVWLAANCVLSTFGIGILGPFLFELGLGDSLATIIFFNLVSVILPALAATFGPKLGLRQMTSARYSWGWHGAKLVALLNCIACVGWSTVNTIAGAQTLSAVSEFTLSSVAGVLILAFCTLIVGLFGYKWVHIYERYSWIPTAIAFFCMLGTAAKHLANTPMPVGAAEAGNVLSMGGVCFGYSVGWISLASDYNVYFPKETASWKIFIWTYAGIAVPLILVEMLGAAVASAAVSSMPSWGDAYNANEIGGLVLEVYRPLGNFGKFLMVLLVLSVVANNIINVYSFPLSLQVVAGFFKYAPRWLLVAVITGIYIPLAIVGAHSFSGSLSSFMNVLSYWLAIFAAVIFEEHYIFRKGKFSNYNVAETWNKKAGVPIGLAALASFGFGVMGAVLGMSQTWYIGVLGRSFGGPFGGDIGFELSGAFTAVTFPVFRWLELKYFHR